MSERISYQFDDFRLDPAKRVLLHRQQPIQLRAKPFEMLLAFVQNHQQGLSKEDLMRRIWPGGLVSDVNFHVHLDAVRKALGETGREPHYILRTAGGYRFAGEVKEVMDALAPSSKSLHTQKTIGQQDEIHDELPQSALAPSENVEPQSWASRIPFAHMATTCVLYAALFAVAVPLEVAYQFDRFGPTAIKIAPLVFAGVLITSIGGLTLDHQLTLRGKTSGALVAIGIFGASAVLLFAALRLFLPPFPITQSSFQTYPAQAAYLKDESFFLILAVFFVIAPFHFIVAMQREIQTNNEVAALNLITGNKASAAPKGTIYPRFWALATLLVVIAALSLASTAHLLDSLKAGLYQNLFVQLIYLRALLFFGLGIECLAWYYRALEELKRRWPAGRS